MEQLKETGLSTTQAGTSTKADGTTRRLGARALILQRTEASTWGSGRTTSKKGKVKKSGQTVQVTRGLTGKELSTVQAPIGGPTVLSTEASGGRTKSKVWGSRPGTTDALTRAGSGKTS